ncbi:exopolysaccharide biosynthesis protein [Phenylobacterium sp. LjRoot164]|uniref:exopolysaccharide biosynthesis protein n=1 Tax=unclassified Phenylobacterium TaxID=2640670 RepID=UPI003ECD63D8
MEQHTQSLAVALRRLLDSRGERVALGEILAGVEEEGGAGPVLLLLVLPILVPLPPGFSMVLSLPLLFVAPQIVLGRRRLWLPRGLRRQSVKHADLAKVIHRLLPLIERMETFVRPRLTFLASGLGVRAVGVACTLIALVLVLPIPFANLAPAAALGVFALGVSRRDGLVVLVGYGLLALAVLVIALGVHGAALGLRHLLS